MAYTLIETHTVESGGATEIEFTGIEAVAGANLVLVVSGKSTRTNSPRDAIKLQFNGVTSGYSYKFLEGTGSTANSSGASSQAQILITHALSTNMSGLGNLFGSATITIPDYAGSQNKSVSSDETAIRNSTDSHSAIQASISTITSPITSIYLSPENGDFMEHTTASLYLVTTADASGATVPVPKATGGTISFSDGYWIHSFTSSGTFTPSETLTCDYLVVAGGASGGAGGNNANQCIGAGGGAGGYRTSVGTSGGGASAESALVLAATSHTVTVGAGGAGNPSSPYNDGNDGNSSTFATVTSIGGGGGGSGYSGYNPTTNRPGRDGGSGGGTPNYLTADRGLGTAGQGSDGGSNNGAGGGGAGANGANGTNSGGAGGIGIASTITGTSVYRGGGAGGGGQYPGGPGIGGTGGGGNGASRYSSPGSATAGTVNTGGGGGGGADRDYNSSAAGGSGVVIVRYAA